MPRTCCAPCTGRAATSRSLKIRKIAAAPWFIPESTALLDQLHAFRERREHFATVVDEYGAFMGIVTLEDILEEIVGDIADEHDRTVAGVRAGRDGSLVVNGDVTIRDLNREYGWDLPDEHAATVAGLVMHEARRIPEVQAGLRLPRLPLRDPAPPGPPRHLHPGRPARRRRGGSCRRRVNLRGRPQP